jgi:hypothetical protein
MHWYTRVEYTYAHQDEFQIGRLYAQPHSLQTMSKQIRSLLAHGVYRDVDIANAQPTITLHIAEQHGWPHRHLKHYVLNRDLQLQTLCNHYQAARLTRADTKQIILEVLNGAAPDNVVKRHNLPTPLPTFCLALRQEASKIVHKFGELIDDDEPTHRPIRARHKNGNKSTDINRTLFSHHVANEENKILQVIKDFWEKHNYDIGTLIFDGLLVASSDALPDTLMRDCERRVLDQTKYEIHLSDSPLVSNDRIQTLPEWVYKDYRTLGQSVYPLAMVDDYIRSTVAYIDHGGNTFCMTRNMKRGCVNWQTLLNSIQSVYKKEVLPFRVAAGSAGFGVYKNKVTDENGKSISYPVVHLNERVRYLQQTNNMFTYDDVRFQPYLRPHNLDTNAFNLFSGFKFPAPPYRPQTQWSADMVAQHTNMAIKHVYTVLADSDAANALYILQFIADMIQRPDKVPGVCLLFMSVMQGTGKNMFWEWVGNVIGRRYFLLSESLEAITQQFNANQQNLLLHVLDEIANYGGSFKSNDQLKTAITRTDIPITPKHKDTFTIEHFARYVMLTNNLWAVRVDNGDRRYIIFRVSDAMAGNSTYFQELATWMENEHNQREFFHLMANMDISEFWPRNGIQSTTLKLQMQFNNSKAMPMRHLISLVIDIPDEGDGSKLIYEAEQLFGEYRDWLYHNRESHSISLREWQSILRDNWAIRTEKVRVETNNTQQCRRFVLTKSEILKSVRTMLKHPTLEFADLDMYPSQQDDSPPNAANGTDEQA